MMKKSNVLFICETWCGSHMKVEQNIFWDSKKCYCRNGYKIGKNNYRGGLAFIVDRNIKCYTKFFSNNVGICRINKLCIIGVYMKYFTGKEVDLDAFREQMT